MHYTHADNNGNFFQKLIDLVPHSYRIVIFLNLLACSMFEGSIFLISKIDIGGVFENFLIAVNHPSQVIITFFLSFFGLFLYAFVNKLLIRFIFADELITARDIMSAILIGFIGSFIIFSAVYAAVYYFSSLSQKDLYLLAIAMIPLPVFCAIVFLGIVLNRVATTRFFMMFFFPIIQLLTAMFFGFSIFFVVMAVMVFVLYYYSHHCNWTPHKMI